jgi:hypothetical protein
MLGVCSRLMVLVVCLRVRSRSKKIEKLSLSFLGGGLLPMTYT